MDTKTTTPTERRLQITPGEWSWRNDDDLRTLHDNGGYQYGAQVLGIGSDIDGAPELVISEPNRELIADAGTTANACDMLPSELLAKLREAEKTARGWMDIAARLRAERDELVGALEAEYERLESKCNEDDARGRDSYWVRHYRDFQQFLLKHTSKHRPE